MEILHSLKEAGACRLPMHRMHSAYRFKAGRQQGYVYIQTVS